MRIVKRLVLSDTDKEDALKLWNNEYPEQLVYSSIEEFEEYLGKLIDQNHALLVDNQERIAGWYFDFIREEQRNFAIILDSEFHGKGFGTKLIGYAKENHEELNGWVIDHNDYKKRSGDNYISPLEFYLKNGFEVIRNEKLASSKITAIKIKWKR
jgi:GNAT superfamily N-acetyltransferase